MVLQSLKRMIYSSAQMVHSRNRQSGREAIELHRGMVMEHMPTGGAPDRRASVPAHVDALASRKRLILFQQPDFTKA